MLNDVIANNTCARILTGARFNFEGVLHGNRALTRLIINTIFQRITRERAV